LAIAERGKLAVWRLADNVRVFEVDTSASSYGNRVAFSADGTRLAVGHGSGISIYAANTGNFLKFLKRVDSPINIYGIAFSPDGRRIAASSGDSYAGGWAIWDVGSGQALLRGQLKNAAYDIAFSPDGQFVAIGGGNYGRGQVGANYGGIPGEVGLFNSLTGEPVRNFSGSRYCIWAVAISPDGTRIACAAGLYQKGIGEVKVWDMATREELLTLPCPHCPFRVAFSNDGSRLAATGGIRSRRKINTLVLWDSRTGKETFRLPISATAYGVAFNPSGTHLAAATFDGVRLWGPSTRPTPATQPSVPTTQPAQ
jgi:WD40 repeat protein